MKKLTHFYLLVLLVLASLALNACAGALDAQGLNFNDLTGSQTLTTESVHSTEPPEIHTTGTPEVKQEGTGKSTDVPETDVPETEVVVKTEAPETEQPHACKTPLAPGTPESDNSHEVLGMVTGVGMNGTSITSLTVNGVQYEVTSSSVIHDKTQMNDTVRLTFRYDSNCVPIVNEVKVTDMNGSSDGQGNGQGNNGNNNSHEGGAHENGTPEPGSGNNGGGG